MTSGGEGELLARGHPIPLARQLAAGLEAAIRDGHIRQGARLPSTRDLARRIGVHRSTVGAAYARLRRRRCIDAAPGRRPRVPRTTEPSGSPCRSGGTRAAQGLRAARRADGEPRTVDDAVRAADRALRAALGAALDGGVSRADVLVALDRRVRALRRDDERREALTLFEPRAGLRRALRAELETRVGVTVRGVGRPPRGAGGAPLLLRREILERWEARRERSALPGPEPLPLFLAGGTRERGLVRRGVRRGLVVFLTRSRALRRYASELAAREFARGVSFVALDPGHGARVVRAVAAARLVLHDAASGKHLPAGPARVEPVQLLRCGQVAALRAYLRCGEGVRAGPRGRRANGAARATSRPARPAVASGEVRRGT